jgi:hypothetical protein
MFKKHILGCFMSLFLVCAYGQGASDRNNPSSEPTWIVAMQDPNILYEQAIAQFVEFWKFRKMPKEAFEEEEESALDKRVEEAREKLIAEDKATFVKNDVYKNRNFAAEVRAFKGWLKEAQLWLKEDGTIYSLEERQAIIDQQQKELKRIEKINQPNR